MTAPLVGTPAPAGPPRTRLVAFARAVVRQSLGQPVREGRLREEGWPYGLRAVVLLGYAVFALAGVTVLVAGFVRRHATLTPAGASAVALPAASVWLVLTLLSFGLALLLAAAVHSPWWLRLAGLAGAAAATGVWSVRAPSLAGSVVWPVLAGVLIVALVVFVLVRGRRAYAWWELVVIWALVGATLLVGVVENRFSRAFGFDQAPLLLQYTASVLGYLALPTAIVAGAAVAEVSVRIAASATQQAQRLARPGWPYAVLAVVALARAVQVVRQVAGRDPVTDGWSSLVPALVLVAGFGVLGWALLRIARRHRETGGTVAGGSVAGALGDELSRVGLTIAAVLIVVNLPLQVGGSVVPVLVSFDPGGPLARAALDPGALVGRLVDPIRAVVGVVLVGLAFRAARRGRVVAALLGGTVGVMLVGSARALFLRSTTNAVLDPDALNLVATVVVVVALLVTALRRRLTGRRAIAYAGALTLSALFSSRDFVSDPVGALLGWSGAALVLFGLVWDLFTGSSWGNGESRRFPRPTRVLLVLANAVVTMSVLAYAALVRDGSTTIYLDVYAEFGDYLFGTALTAAALVALLDAAARDEPVGEPD